MTFILRKSSPYVFALSPLKIFSDHDTPVVKTYVTKDNLPDSGADRVKRIFQTDENGDISPELQYCLHLSTMGLIIGGLYGGIIRGRSAFITFIDSNEATMFRNHLDAKRQLQDTVSLSIAKGAAQWGWRTFFFTSTYAITSTAIAVFRGKSGIIEHIDAGVLAGALYNMKNGFRGIIVGGGLGGALGGIFGSMFYGFLLLTGQTMEEVRFWTHEWKTRRDDLASQHQRRKRIQEDEDELIRLAEKLTDPEIQKLQKKTPGM